MQFFWTVRIFLLYVFFNCLFPCKPVGLGCYWVDYSELWKRTFLSVTSTCSGNSSLCFPPFHLSELPWSVLCVKVCISYSALSLFVCIHRSPHKPLGSLQHHRILCSWCFNNWGGFLAFPPTPLSPLEYIHWTHRRLNAAKAECLSKSRGVKACWSRV